MKGNLRGFLFRGSSLLGDFNPKGNVLFPLNVCVFTNDVDSYSVNVELFFEKFK